MVSPAKLLPGRRSLKFPEGLDRNLSL